MISPLSLNHKFKKKLSLIWHVFWKFSSLLKCFINFRLPIIEQSHQLHHCPQVWLLWWRGKSTYYIGQLDMNLFILRPDLVHSPWLLTALLFDTMLCRLYVFCLIVWYSILLSDCAICVSGYGLLYFLSEDLVIQAE